jgi:hypothetical protein
MVWVIPVHPLGQLMCLAVHSPDMLDAHLREPDLNVDDPIKHPKGGTTCSREQGLDPALPFPRRIWFLRKRIEPMLQFDAVSEGRKQDGSRPHPTSRNQITNRACALSSTFCTSPRMAERIELISQNRTMSLRESVSSVARLHKSLKRSVLCASVAMVIVTSFLSCYEHVFREDAMLLRISEKAQRACAKMRQDAPCRIHGANLS